MIPRAADIETRLREQYGDGSVHTIRLVIEELATHFGLTPDELAESDGSHPRFAHKIHSALAKHYSLKLLIRPERGAFRYIPEKLKEYEPRHHPPRVHKTGKSPQQETVAEAVRRLYPTGPSTNGFAQNQQETVAKAIRRLKRKRRAITLAIRELEKGSS